MTHSSQALKYFHANALTIIEHKTKLQKLPQRKRHPTCDSLLLLLMHRLMHRCPRHSISGNQGRTVQTVGLKWSCRLPSFVLPSWIQERRATELCLNCSEPREAKGPRFNRGTMALPSRDLHSLVKNDSTVLATLHDILTVTCSEIFVFGHIFTFNHGQWGPEPLLGPQIFVFAQWRREWMKIYSTRSSCFCHLKPRRCNLNRRCLGCLSYYVKKRVTSTDSSLMSNSTDLERRLFKHHFQHADNNLEMF